MQIPQYCHAPLQFRPSGCSLPEDLRVIQRTDKRSLNPHFPNGVFVVNDRSTWLVIHTLSSALQAPAEPFVFELTDLHLNPDDSDDTCRRLDDFWRESEIEKYYKGYYSGMIPSIFISRDSDDPNNERSEVSFIDDRFLPFSGHPNAWQREFEHYCGSDVTRELDLSYPVALHYARQAIAHNARINRV